VTFRPQKQSVALARSDPWESLGNRPTSRFQVGQRTVSGVVTAEDLGLTDISVLQTWMVTVHLVNSGEWFSFPGRGPYNGWVQLISSQTGDYASAIEFPGSAETSAPDRHPGWLYDYLTKEWEGIQEDALRVPVYVAVDKQVSTATRYRLLVDNEQWVEMEWLSATVLGGQIPISSFPQSLSIQLFAGDRQTAGPWQRQVWNRSQAVTLGVVNNTGKSLVASLPDDFVFGVCPCDVWGTVIYALPGNWQEGHTRDYVCETFRRIAEAGASDVVVTSFYGWKKTSPLPEISYTHGGTATISEDDLRYISKIAHELGLTVTTTYNNGVCTND